MSGPGSRPNAIAVDLGATNIRAGLVRGDGLIIRHSSVRTPVSPRDADLIIRTISDLIDRTVPAGDMESVAGIGVSTAGPVDLRRGEVVNPPNIPLKSIPVKGPLEERFSLPVSFMNDCHAGAIGEARFGAGRDIRNFMYLTISTGIGAGVFERGRLLFGEDGNFAEVGHLCVETTWNLPCGCGGSGHWEGCGSGRFIPAFFREWCRLSGYTSPFAVPPDTAGIFRAAEAGNQVAVRFLAALGGVQATGISSLVAAYDPSLIIIDGSVARRNWAFFESSVIPRVRSVSGRKPGICMSPLDGNAPLIGAAACALDGTLSRALNPGVG